jgi:hypothetical protein
MKFRIVEYTHNVSEIKHNNLKIEYVIEKKNTFGWKEIVSKEITSKRISHKTYQDAEAYMMCNYMGRGVCKKIGVEYEYTEYTYYY